MILQIPNLMVNCRGSTTPTYALGYLMKECGSPPIPPFPSHHPHKGNQEGLSYGLD